MTKTVTMMEKVTKIMIKSRYSPISGITWRQTYVMGTASVEQLALMFETQYMLFPQDVRMKRFIRNL